MKFSQRIGQTKIKTLLQKEEIDDELKIKLWNVFHDDFFSYLKINYSGLLSIFLKEIWADFFNHRSNKFSINTAYNLGIIENWFFKKTKWYEVYDFIEFVGSFENKPIMKFTKMNFIKNCNKILVKQLSAYRIINYQVTPISDATEMESIENATKNNGRFEEVSTHLNTSINYLSNRENPDYRNSIKESISAVETICKIITSENTLGKALNNLENNGVKIHPNMKSAFDKLYAYTNDSKTGIRHAIIDGVYSPDFDEAKFMLVTCSTFINYLKSKVT